MKFTEPVIQLDDRAVEAYHHLGVPKGGKTKTLNFTCLSDMESCTQSMCLETEPDSRRIRPTGEFSPYKAMLIMPETLNILKFI